MVKVVIYDQLQNQTTFNVYLSTGLSKVFSTYADRKGMQVYDLYFECGGKRMAAEVRTVSLVTFWYYSRR